MNISKHRQYLIPSNWLLRLLLGLMISFSANSGHAGIIASTPLFLSSSVPPIVMMVMGRNHRLYYEAYNDASDLDEDGLVDVGYKPGIDYYGYFDSHRCYDYVSSSDGYFEPKDATLDKTCSGVDGAWSGDFLNYVTTSRIDALRKVLYGGYRSTDTTSQTTLKRAFIPQDAHSWGKEYDPASKPGYLISDYTPLSEPALGTRHLFANTSLSYTGQPLMRVLNDSQYRIWEWVSIERPVAGSKCLDGGGSINCATSASASWSNVPSVVFSNLVRTTYNMAGTGETFPSNHTDFTRWISTYAVPERAFGSGSMTSLVGNDQNPYGADDYYMTIVKGAITVPATGSYKFAVDGDDAVEVVINGTYIAGWYGGHSANSNDNSHTVTITLTAGVSYPIEFHHQEYTGGDSFALRWQKSIPESKMTDYSVNVNVCVAGKLEANCKAYNDGASTTYKPIGLLHTYGEKDAMQFGLLTGTYKKNISGGALRKNIGSFTDEVDPSTGIFTNVNGIVKTINQFRVTTFNYSNYTYASQWITTRPINEGEAAEWGEPIAEMMYEGLRYFAGKTSPIYGISSSDNPDASLGLPAPTWISPYKPKALGGAGYLSCAKPIELVIGDINVSYDTDQLPGSSFNSFSGDLGLNVSTLADTIWAEEYGGSKLVFIGESGSNHDKAPTAKTVTSFKDIRGLAPEEPTKLGGYYAGSVALFGAQNDLNSGVSGNQKALTLAVALASTLPRIEIPVGGKKVTLVPFAKSVRGSSINASSSSFQPTNQIVDFYIEKIVNTSPDNMDASVNDGRAYGKFRINYEDVEQAADHDMDAIVEYTFSVDASNKVVIALNSTYAAGGITQHMGYIISGTTADGIYLEVLDQRNGDVSYDTDYYLDTPPGQPPGGNWADGQPLPFSTSRTFTVGATSASYIDHNPLWYAAKWGSNDTNGNGVLDTEEWDSDNDGVPDSYFLVTNAGNLPEQLGKAFAKALGVVSSASAVAANSTRLDTGSKIYQAKFNSTDWSGQLIAFSVDADTGALSKDWDASELIPDAGSRNIYTYNPSAAPGSKGIPFLWANLDTSQQTYLDVLFAANDGYGEQRLEWLRGDAANEQKNAGGIFRDRTNLLGDIVNSDPVFVGGQNYGYAKLSGGLGTSYKSYLKTTKNRKPMIYTGANDGMLHGFDASGAGGGKEVLAYIPNDLFPKLSELTLPSYAHQYYVDGTPAVGDVYYNSSWHTLLAGTTGAGGRAVFGLDVTDPSAFGPSSVLWEFTNTDDTDLGYTLAQPLVARLQDGKWVVIVGNGYSSDNGHAVLFVLDAQTGVVLQKIDTGAGSIANKNGLSSPIAVDTDNDLGADTVYAGDLYGNLWKFDLSGPAGSWPVPTAPLFVACTTTGASCSTDNRQPITGKPNVGSAGGVGTDQNGVGLMVYFGTGKYFETTDNIVGADPQVQTFYGLWDKGEPITDRSMLQEQTIKYEGTFSTVGGGNTTYPIRVVPKSNVCYQVTEECASTDVKKGWALNLISPVLGAEGERVVSFPLLRRGLVVFASIIPNADPCSFGGKSWLMEIDALNGGAFRKPPFDTNGDDKVDNGDNVTIDGETYSPGGINLDVGIIKTPAVIEAKLIDRKYVSGSNGEDPTFATDFGGGTGRGSWRQLK